MNCFVCVVFRDDLVSTSLCIAPHIVCKSTAHKIQLRFHVKKRLGAKFLYRFFFLLLVCCGFEMQKNAVQLVPSFLLRLSASCDIFMNILALLLEEKKEYILHRAKAEERVKCGMNDEICLNFSNSFSFTSALQVNGGF